MPMMKPVIFINKFKHTSPHRQQGAALFEALIGFLLLLVLGLGLSYSAARTLHSQRYASTQSVALNQLRGSLQSTGLQALCNGSSATVRIKPAGGDVQEITVATPQPSCHRDNISVGVASTAALNVTLTGTANSVVTRMRFATPEHNDVASSLLGDGATVLSQ